MTPPLRPRVSPSAPAARARMDQGVFLTISFLASALASSPSPCCFTSSLTPSSDCPYALATSLSLPLLLPPSLSTHVPSPAASHRGGTPRRPRDDRRKGQLLLPSLLRVHTLLFPLIVTCCCLRKCSPLSVLATQKSLSLSHTPVCLCISSSFASSFLSVRERVCFVSTPSEQ